MTHEEIVDIAKLGKPQGGGYFIINQETLNTFLTTYRAQVEMEERGNLRHAILQIAEKQTNDETQQALLGVVRGLDLISEEAINKHPTN